MYPSFIFFYLISYVSSSLCKNLEGKVVGGEYAAIKNFPHVAFLEIDVEGAKFICGSSILNQVLLVTAAHCFEAITKDSYIGVYAGHHDVFKVTLVRSAKAVYRHKSYDSDTIVNDIALVKLKEALPLGNLIKRVILRPSTPKDGEEILAGWGAINAQMSEFDYKLKSVSQKLRSKDSCSRIGSLHPGMICAGSFDPKMARPSKGDSGSGLVSKDYQIVGLVSHLVNAYPAIIVYTNVSYYYTWVHDKAEKILCPID
ncbi:unnamed protein product [Leptosia nina]|uniref:Peptidase S1 domain-containing protein n=1 Tax=Leptosia nina TaxID=320188 RepID=A0AAV1JV55_9NEOP